MGCDTGVEGLHASERGGCEGEVSAYLAFETGKEEGAAYVGEEADAGFGHGEDGVFGCDADGGVDGEADATAHGDSVEVGDVGLWVGGNEVVEFVFEAKVVFGGRTAGVTVGGDVVGEVGYIAAGAEGFGAGAADYDDGCEGGFLVFL